MAAHGCPLIWSQVVTGSQRWNKLVHKSFDVGDERGLKLVQAILKPIMLRRTKLSTEREGRTIIVLPPADIQVIYCNLSETEEDFYGALFKKSKVIFDKRIPVKNLNETKSALVGALASHGQLYGALNLYEEIKEADCHLDPKAIRCLIEHFQSKGELNRLLQLLEELTSSPYWVDSCFRVISYCVQHEHLRSTLDLLKQVKDKFSNYQVATEVLFDEVFCFIVEKEGKDMQFGLDLLQAIKTELGVRPSRKSLDFLLSACVNCKDAKTSFAIWEEYKKAGLPYNVLSFVSKKEMNL